MWQTSTDVSEGLISMKDAEITASEVRQVRREELDEELVERML